MDILDSLSQTLNIDRKTLTKHAENLTEDQKLFYDSKNIEIENSFFELAAKHADKKVSPFTFTLVIMRCLGMYYAHFQLPEDSKVPGQMFKYGYDDYQRVFNEMEKDGLL